MKRHKYYFLLFSCVVLLFGVSCKKYLDVKSNDVLVSPTSVTDFVRLMDDATNMNRSAPSFGMSSSDDYFITDISYNAKGILLQNVYKWIPFEYRFPNDWANCYRVIYNTNLVLERLTSVNTFTETQQEFDECRGTALFFRSYYYLELSWLFSKAYDNGTAATDPGIVLREGSDFNQPSVRSSVKECYEKIIADAKEAVIFLPEQVPATTRPSKAAAYGLLARAYLSMRIYDSAGKYVDLALQRQSTLMNYNDPAQVNINGTLPFKRFNIETVFYASMNPILNLHHPSSGPGLIDTSLKAQYEVNDLRRKAFFAASGNYFKIKGNYAGETASYFSGIAVDELYLMRAETYARAGNTQAAMDDLNTLLRKRWLTNTYVDLTATDAQQALQIILTERRKELLYRGSLRWMDIKRLNKEGANIVLQRKIAGEIFTLPPNDKRYALPIPTDIIELSGIEQN